MVVVTRINVLVLGFILMGSAAHAEMPWPRHTVDTSSEGADGAKLQDVNADGLPDLVVPWEEGGQIRVYLHPGPKKVTQRWPSVTVGMVTSPEDAIFVDLDHDGHVDVVSCCEGTQRTIQVHWAPKWASDYLDASQWKTEQIPCTVGEQMWMFAVSMQVDGHAGTDLIVGSKGVNASVSWLESPEDPRKLDEWKLHHIIPAGWIMSLRLADMNADGQHDLLLSDRRGMTRGVKWLEVPSNPVADKWPVHNIGGRENEVMFLDIADLDGDRQSEVVVATHQSKMLVLSQELLNGKTTNRWSHTSIANPHAIPKGKGVAIGDLNQDGFNDIVHSTEPSGDPRLSGVTWLRQERVNGRVTWVSSDISGPDGIKFDLVRLFDLDQDGDLDVITCEERHNLGVIWYENPSR